MGVTNAYILHGVKLMEFFQDWTLDKVPPYLDIKCVQIKETCINQILVCS